MWKALKNNVFGHNEGDLFDAPLHAIQVHLERGEIEEFKEVKIEKVILEETSFSKEEPKVIAETSPLVSAPKSKGRPKGWKKGQPYTQQ